MRNKAPLASQIQKDNPQTQGSTDKGTAGALTRFLDPALNWDDVPWLQANTRLPIVLKGIQTGEDAVLAYKTGVAGIVVSNHGGRQLDFCRSGLEGLLEFTTPQTIHTAHAA